MAPKLQYLKERTTILYFLGFNFSHQLSVEQYSYSQTILNKKILESTENSNLSPWIFCVTRNPHIPLLASHFPILYESLRTFYLILNWVSFLPAKLDPNCQWVQVISYWNIHFFPSTCKTVPSSCWYDSELNFYHSLGKIGSPTNCAMVSYISLVVTSSPFDVFEHKVWNNRNKNKPLIMIAVQSFINELYTNVLLK